METAIMCEVRSLKRAAAVVAVILVCLVGARAFAARRCAEPFTGLGWGVLAATLCNQVLVVYFFLFGRPSTLPRPVRDAWTVIRRAIDTCARWHLDIAFFVIFAAYAASVQVIATAKGPATLFVLRDRFFVLNERASLSRLRAFLVLENGREGRAAPRRSAGLILCGVASRE